MMNIRMGGRFAVIAVGAVALAVALAGCSPSSPSAAPPAPAQSGVPAPGPSATPTAAPRYDATGTAAQNLAFFKSVGYAKIGQHPNITGKGIVAVLVSAGFDKKLMEITPDKTSIGLTAWNIEFSVKLNGSCLIGQAGNVGFHGFATRLLASGKCLVGTTRKIDW